MSSLLRRRAESNYIKIVYFSNISTTLISQFMFMCWLQREEAAVHGWFPVLDGARGDPGSEVQRAGEICTRN